MPGLSSKTHTQSAPIRPAADVTPRDTLASGSGLLTGNLVSGCSINNETSEARPIGSRRAGGRPRACHRHARARSGVDVKRGYQPQLPPSDPTTMLVLTR